MTTLIDLEARAGETSTSRTPSGWTLRAAPSAHPDPTPTNPPPSGPAAHVRDAASAPVSDRYVAPARFDVHRIEALERWAAVSIEMGASRLAVDCSRVEFIDLAALEALDRLEARHALEIVDRSLAHVITSRLVGADASELAEAA